MHIEQTTFELGQRVRLSLNPVQKGQIVAKKTFADGCEGGLQYDVDYLNNEGELRTATLFGCELENDEEI